MRLAEPALAGVAIGETDCEGIHEGALAQPVNAITSFGYVAAGLALIVRGARRGRAESSSELIYGATLVAIGLGSVAFHGPQPAGSQFVHDVPIAAALLYIFLHNLERLGRVKNANGAFLVGLIPVVGLFAATPALAQAVAAALAGAAIVTQVVVYRSNSDRGFRRNAGLTAGLLTLAGLGYFFGRTGSVVCDPDSLFQIHGLWHLLSASAFMVWGFAAFDRTLPERVQTG